MMAGSAADGAGAEVDASLGPQSVHRALEVLTHVVDHGPLALSDIARASRLPTSTTLRMLRALEHWGYASRGTDGRYSPGVRFVQSTMSNDNARAEELIDLSAALMQRLTAQTQESSYLAIPGPANTCTFLREVQSPLPIRHVGFDGWAGRTVPMSGSVVGEIFENRTPEEGYVVMAAVDDPDATVVGAPVHGSGGAIIAAISVAGPRYRMDGSRIAEFGHTVVAAAQELTAQLEARTP
ncbi:IclR family transcriptional regulator [Microbacterium sp. NPDC058342]|uniref:IclR family transcriptional regulator n=1 Tax=Microbacterium sp. NPDC058342 TaxID=3346454 RepID=UPI0036620BAE